MDTATCTARGQPGVPLYEGNLVQDERRGGRTCRCRCITAIAGAGVAVIAVLCAVCWRGRVAVGRAGRPSAEVADPLRSLLEGSMGLHLPSADEVKRERQSCTKQGYGYD